ncbi:neuroligin-4, X-linked-like [Babylonia areolata]|uniref:neuroligin-4, X-linked-like n=1 Tax=Babylonia areolata TaxID=304850 RepID=UPI003FD2B17C
MTLLWSVRALFCALTVLGSGSGGLGAGSSADHSLTVTTRYGSLHGTRSTLGTAAADSYVDVFHNIPYAQPPVGDLRFEKPVPPHRWHAVRDATKPGAQCPQRHRNVPPSRRFVNDEDCLYLNVYRPKIGTGEGPLPVMVWVHGGSYYASTGNYYDGTQLAAKGVVVVTINYRLDALGFFSMESPEAPGNYGLWDMIQALEWVRDAISAFHGDPSDVTIFGESSGSTSVSLLALSQAAKGLFQKAIMESGVSLTTWAAAHQGVWPVPRVQARSLAKGLHCDASDTAVMMACLRSKDAMAIVNVSTDMQRAAGDILFRPVIEATFGQGGLFSATPLSLLEAGAFNNVTALRGYNRFESSSVSDVETLKSEYLLMMMLVVRRGDTKIRVSVDDMVLVVRREDTKIRVSVDDAGDVKTLKSEYLLMMMLIDTKIRVSVDDMVLVVRRGDTKIRVSVDVDAGGSDVENDGLTVEEFRAGVHNLAAWYVSRYSKLSADDIVATLLDAYVTSPNVTDPLTIRQAAIQLRTDYGFVAPTIQELTLTTAVNPNPQFLYQFSYRSANRQSPQWQGAEHADELHYVFGSPLSDDIMWNGFVTTWTDEDKRVSDDVMTLWTNFAKYGASIYHSFLFQQKPNSWKQQNRHVVAMDADQSKLSGHRGYG